MSVLAVPPFDEAEISLPGSGVTIVYPIFFGYNFQHNITLNFDVLNSSNAKLDDTSVTCSFDIVDQDGTSLISNGLNYDTTNEYWSQILDATLFDIGQYNYYVHCNSTQDEWGYVSQGIELTGDGQQIHEDLSPLTAVILIPLVLALMLLFAIKVLGDGHAALKIFMFLLSFISVSVSYNYALKIITTFYASSSLVEFIAQDYAWYGYVIYILIIYFIIHWIIQITTNLNDRKTRKLKFEDGDGDRKW